MVVHVPHASTIIPDHVGATLALTDAELEAELLRMTDRHTDRLFALPPDLGRTVAFPLSRLVVDPERFEEDAREPMAARGMGAVYTRTSGGAPLRRALPAAERERLLAEFYRPHHRALAAAVRTALETHGRCLILDAHSFASEPLPHEPDPSPDRPEICIGTDLFHTPARLRDRAVEAFRSAGFTVQVDRPFSGALVPQEFYRSRAEVLSIMVEVNRSLYMDEATGEPLPGFEAFRRRLYNVLSELCAVA